MSVNNQISFRNTLESTTPSRSPNSGALILKGGLTINCTAPATSSSSGGALTVLGGASFAKDVHVSGSLHAYSFEGVENLETPGFTFTDSTPSTSPNSGALITFGGIGINNDTDSINVTNGGTITSSGGMSIAKTLYAKDTIVSGVSEFVSGTVNQDTTLPLGGIGINCNEDATSPSNGGAITIAGGLATAKDLYIGTALITPSIHSDTTLVINATDLSMVSSGSTQALSQNTNLTVSNTITIASDIINITSNSTMINSINVEAVNGGIALVSDNGYTTNSNNTTITSTNDTTISSNGSIAIDSETLVSVLAPEIEIQGPTEIQSAVTVEGSVNLLGGLGVSGEIHGSEIFDDSNNVFTQVGLNLENLIPSTISMIDDPEFDTILLTSNENATSNLQGGALTISGGLSINKSLFVGESITTPLLNVTNEIVIPSLLLTDTIDSTSSDFGALVSPGGLAISNTEDSENLFNGGSLTVAGGVSIGKTLRCGTGVNSETITSTGEFSLSSGNLSCKLSSNPSDITFIKVYPDGNVFNWSDVGVSHSGEYQLAVNMSQYVYISYDYGITWDNRVPNNGININKLAISNDAMYQSITDNQYGDIYTSNDQGGSWTRFIFSIGWNAIEMSYNGSVQIAAGTSSQIYRSIDYGATWNTTSSPVNDWKGLAISFGGNVQTAVCWVDSSNTGGLFNSTDNGETWNVNNNAGSRYWKAVSMSYNGVYQTAVAVGSSDESIGDYIYYSSNSGETWTQNSLAGLRRWSAVTVSSTGIYQFATTIHGLVYFSKDYGVNWTTLPSITTNKDTTCIATSFDSSYILVGLNTEPLHRGYINNDIILLDKVTFDQNNTFDALHLPSKVCLTSTSSTQFTTLYLGTPKDGEIINARKSAIITRGRGSYSKNELHIVLDDSDIDSRPALLGVSGPPQFSIYPDGNVGVGLSTFSPSTKLDINGNMSSESILFSDSILNKYYEYLWQPTITVVGNNSPPTPLSPNVRITRVGNRVSIHFPDIHFTGGIVGTTSYFETSVVPLEFQPTTNVSVITRNAINNITIGLCRYNTQDGKIRFYHNLDESTFSGGGGYYIFTRTLFYTLGQ